MIEFKLKKPCSNCPFRKDSLKGWLGEARATQIAKDVILGDQTFACHKTVNYEAWQEQQEEDEEDYRFVGGEQFCAGALALEMKCNNGGNFAIRLARMGKMFDYHQLKAIDLVFENTEQFIEHHSNGKR